MNLGKAIESLRELREMKKADLAASTGLSAAFLSYIENNKRDPTVSSLEIISKGLKVSLFTIYLVAIEEKDTKEIEYKEIVKLRNKVISLLKEEQD